jgi:hypothetical protein
VQLVRKPLTFARQIERPFGAATVVGPNDVVAQVIDRWYAHLPPAKRSARAAIRTVKAR